MGTNYYLHEKRPCDCCGREYAGIHIGKSSGGWVFSLHIISEAGINSVGDWIERWSKPGAYIVNEYGEEVSPQEMRAIITERQGRASWDDWNPNPFYVSERQFHEQNHSLRGPNGLLRHKIGPHCVGHGDGTWDYISGDFS